MSDREVRVEDGFVVGTADDTVHHKLRAKGYSVGGYIDKGVPRYVLYRKDDAAQKYERIHEFNSAEELNNMVKLLIEEGD